VYSLPGGTGHDALSGSIGAPNADSEPFGFYNPATGIHHVIYRSGGHLQVLYWSGDSPAGHEYLTVGAGAIEAQGNPAGYVVTARGTHVVVYRGADDHIRSIYWTQGPAGMDDLSGFTQSPPAAGDPVATYIQSRDTQHIVYRSADGHIHLVEGVGEAPATALDLTAATAAPPAASDPSLWYNAATDTQNVVFRDDAGHVHLLDWTPGSQPRVGDLTVAAYAPAAASKPFGYMGPTHHNVAYGGTDGQVHEIRWP
jgi:hypothetical protein